MDLNCLKLSLFLTWCCLYGLGLVIDHHPVLEGSSTTLVCTGNASKNRSVYWRKIFPNKSSARIVTCHFSDGLNCSKHAPECQAQYITTDHSFNSSLTLPISGDDRNMNVVCSVFDYTRNSSYTVCSWNFRMIYQPARDYVCRAAQLDFHQISINCSVEGIYPGFICEMFEIFETKTSAVNITEIKYSELQSDSRGYISAFCYAVRKFPRLGIYRYRIEIFPDLALKDVKAAVRKRETEAVEISSKPAVVLEQERCPDKHKRLVFKCMAYWLSAKPNFQWYVDERVINETNNSVVVFNEQNYFMSQAELPGNTSQNGRQIECKVQIGSHISLSYRQKIRHIWPEPQRPHFIYESKDILGGLFTQSELKQVDMFTCNPNGNKRNITDLNVLCKIGSKQLLELNGNTSVSFNINYSVAENVHCKCFVRYTTQCVLSTELNIIKGKAESHFQPLSKTKTVMIIAAGFLLLILLMCLIATLLFLRNRWGQLYTYVYSKYGGSNFKNTGCEENSLYSYVREEIRGRFSTASGIHSRSGMGNETEEVRSLERAYGVYNNSQCFSEFSDSDCADLECSPPPLPPRDNLTSMTIIPVTQSRRTSRKNPECGKLSSSARSCSSNPRPNACNLSLESESCTFNLTDDGYLKPTELLSHAHQFQRDASFRNNERWAPQPCQLENASTAEYLHIVPDLPAREPLLAGALKKSSRHLRHTAEFI